VEKKSRGAREVPGGFLGREEGDLSDVGEKRETRKTTRFWNKEKGLGGGKNKGLACQLMLGQRTYESGTEKFVSGNVGFKRGGGLPNYGGWGGMADFAMRNGIAIQFIKKKKKKKKSPTSSEGGTRR